MMIELRQDPRIPGPPASRSTKVTIDPDDMRGREGGVGALVVRECRADLLHVAETGRLTRFFTGLGEDGKEDRGQDGNDRNDDKEFDECEAATVTYGQLHEVPPRWLWSALRADPGTCRDGSGAPCRSSSCSRCCRRCPNGRRAWSGCGSASPTASRGRWTRSARSMGSPGSESGKSSPRRCRSCATRPARRSFGTTLTDRAAMIPGRGPGM